MSASAIYDIVMGHNAPPGLIHPLLKENYAWVDERLQNNQYSYQYNYEDCDDCEYGFMPRPCPIAWVDYRYNHIAKGIEEFDEPIVIDYKRRRAESDISDHEDDIINAFKKMKFDNSKTTVTESKYTFEPLSNPFCNLDCEDYNYKCSLIGHDEEDSDKTDPELNELFANWDSEIKQENTQEDITDNISVKADYFDSDDDEEEAFDNISVISYDEEERKQFEDMMDGYDSDEWYINLAYCC